MHTSRPCTLAGSPSSIFTRQEWRITRGYPTIQPPLVSPVCFGHNKYFPPKLVTTILPWFLQGSVVSYADGGDYDDDVPDREKVACLFVHDRWFEYFIKDILTITLSHVGWSPPSSLWCFHQKLGAKSSRIEMSRKIYTKNPSKIFTKRK